MPIIRESWMLWPVAFVVAVGQGLCYPSLHSLISKSAPPEQMGSVLGLAASMGSLARMIGPVMFGALWDLERRRRVLHRRRDRVRCISRVTRKQPKQA
jgi:MFS family permease